GDRGRSGGAPVGEQVLSEGLTENQLRGLRRRLPMIAEEVELVTELRQRVDGGDDAPEHPVQLPELEKGHARVGSPPVRVLVVSDEAGIDDGRAARDVDDAGVRGELREQALGEHAVEEELR